MGRKNTAEAFEVLLEIAEEEKRRRKAAAAPAGASDQRPPDQPRADSAPGHRLHILERVDGPARSVLPPAPSATFPSSPAMRLRRDPLLRAPAEPLGAARRSAFPGQSRGSGSAAGTPAAPPPDRTADGPLPADNPGAPLSTVTSPLEAPRAEPTVSEAVASRTTTPGAARPPAAPAKAAAPAGRRARKGLGRWLSRGRAESAPAAEAKDLTPRPAGGGFHAKVDSLRADGAATGEDAPADLPEEFLSSEERRVLSGGWGPGRKPSIDPEVLRSLEDARRSAPDSAGRAPGSPRSCPASPRSCPARAVSHEIRLLEPREPPPSRLGLWDETPEPRSGGGSPGAKPAAGGKAASGPAKRSRSRRGAASPRRPREDLAPPAPLEAPGGCGQEPTGPGDPPKQPVDETTAPPPAVVFQPAEIPPPPARELAPVEALEPAGAPVDTFPDQRRVFPDQPPAFPDQPPAFPDQPPAFPDQPPRAFSLPVRRVVMGLAAIPGIRGFLRNRRGSLLDRQVELKVSTIAAVTLAGSILLVLVLTYLRLPPREDAMLASFLPESPSGKGAGAPARGGAEAESGEEKHVGTDSLRSLPLWSPISAPPGEALAAVPPADQPEIRNVDFAPAGDGEADLETSPAGAGATEGAANAEPPAPARTVHMIQVRAHESMEGARRILDYLDLFGFQKPQIEPDPRGARNWEGKALYTVFVGAHEDRAEADRELKRLKRATRERPFRNRDDFRDFFEDALVITRTRR